MSEIEQILQESQALLTGHFCLTSGRHSNKYIEKIRIIHRPDLVERIGKMLAVALKDVDCDLVVGPAYGGIVLAYETARHLGKPFVFTQREQGVMTIRPGFPVEQGQKAIIIEDIVTTGGSVEETMTCLRERGMEVSAVGLIVDRSAGKVDFGVPTYPLLSLDVQSWAPEDVPDWLAAIPVTKPGSSGKK